MTPIRDLAAARLYWVELPDGWGRHTVQMADIATYLPTKLAEVRFRACYVSPVAWDELPDLGRLAVGAVIELDGLTGRWEVIRVTAELDWEVMRAWSGEVGGSTADHGIRLLLRPEGARYFG